MQNRYLIIFIAILIYFIFQWKNNAQKYLDQEKVFIFYSGITFLVVIFPITNYILTYYQTRFYKNEWTWSLVPILIFIEYGVVKIIKEQKLKRVFVVIAGVARLFLLGNHFKFKRL